MTFNASLGQIGSILRLVTTFLGKKPAIPGKDLRAQIVMRAIVSELPPELSLKIVDATGRAHQGVYVLNVLVWNRGSQAISPLDFLDNAPLRLAVDKEAYIIMADCLSNDDQLACSAPQVDEQSVDIYFDCINPGDYLNIVLFYGGNPMADVQILGRIQGQATSIDRLADEVRASVGERLVNLCVLLMIVNMFVGLPISTWIIYRFYGFKQLLHQPPNLPMTLMASLITGLMLLYMFIHSRISMWWERRKYPPGYPLHSDFEPPLLQNLRAMVVTVFAGKKHRLSTSMFDWAQPVIIRHKKSRRRRVEDWIA